MHSSHPIDIGGHFVGVAIADAAGWRFRAVDPALKQLEGTQFITLAATRRAAHVVRLQTPHPVHSPAEYFRPDGHVAGIS